jgi:hypothetical protein
MCVYSYIATNSELNIIASLASEPNLLKIRLKQSVIERKARAGPLAQRRQERLLLAHQRRLQKQVALAQVTSTCLKISNVYLKCFTNDQQKVKTLYQF